MQPQTLRLFKASDGAEAVDMSVALVSDPVLCNIGEYASIQIVNPAGVTGSWTIEDTNTFNPQPLSAGWDPFPADLMSSAATQPSGTACTTTLCTFATCRNKRAKWTPTSGGQEVLPTSILAERGGGL